MIRTRVFLSSLVLICFSSVIRDIDEVMEYEFQSYRVTPTRGQVFHNFPPQTTTAICVLLHFDSLWFRRLPMELITPTFVQSASISFARQSISIASHQNIPSFISNNTWKMFNNNERERQHIADSLWK